MRIKSRFGAVAIVVLLMNWPCNGYFSSQQTEASSDEYSVYQAVIANMFADGKMTVASGERAAQDRLVIEDRTVIAPAYQATMLTSLQRETIDDFSSKNKKATRLKKSFILTVTSLLRESSAAGQTQGERTQDQTSTAKSHLSLSRVGFDRDRTQAVVYVSYRCGGWCGQSYFYLLTKARDEWVIQERFLTSIS